MSYLDTFNKEFCCGCSACYNICPQKAIGLVRDDKGFIYPEINKNDCIKCNLCKNVCQFKNESIENAFVNVECYAVKHENTEVIKQSRSAGAFTLFTDYILQNDGVIYGCVLDEELKIHHIRATTELERNKCRESKYVQSEITGVYDLICKDLKNGKLVVFSGTGCQCDALRSFLNLKKINIANLYLIDIVCHGVPSPKMYREYIEWIEQKYHSSVVDFKFRDKEKFNWAQGVEKICLKNGKKRYQDYFTHYIFSHYVRSSCYKCKYTTPYRNSDITLADFWGVEKVLLDMYDSKNGCSLVLLHSDKAKILFEKVKSNSVNSEVSLDMCMQPRLLKPIDHERNESFFWKQYLDGGISKVIKNAKKIQSLKSKIKLLISNII